MNWLRQFFRQWAADMERAERIAAGRAAVRFYNDNCGEKCNLCRQPYRGLSMDCGCTDEPKWRCFVKPAIIVAVVIILVVLV